MTTVTIDEAQANLPQVIDRLRPGDEVVVTRNDKVIARILPPELPHGTRVPGRGKGRMSPWVEDDSHLEHFAEYMP